MVGSSEATAVDGVRHAAGHVTAIIFRLPGPESAHDACRLSETLRLAGYSPVTVPYWNDEAAVPDSGQFPLFCGAGLEEVPRWSAYGFRTKFGYDLDVFDLSAHSMAIGDVRTDTVLAESVWNQKLRGVAAIAHDLMARIAPSAVFIAHGAEVVSRILEVAVAKLGIRYLYWESPFFPNHHFVDPVGPHFFRNGCYLDKHWSERPEPAQEHRYRAAASTFIDAWKKGKQSKYSQQTEPDALGRLREWTASDARPVLFIPGQLPHDANVVVSLRNYEDFPGICQDIVRAVPRTWRIVFKPHPRDATPTAWDVLLGPDVLVVRDVGIHELFDVADAVATHSSNVGLEALMAGLPVIVWGDPVYSRKGLTEDIPTPEGIAALLATGRLQPPPRENALTLIGQILEKTLIEHGDGRRLARLIEEAGSPSPPRRLPWYGLHVRQLASAAEALDRELRRGEGIGRAIAELPTAERSMLQRRFGDELLGHHFGGPQIPGTQALEAPPSLKLEHLFAQHLPEAVRFDRTDLQNSLDPIVSISRITRQVSPQTSVVLEMEGARERAWTIQSLTAGEVSRLVGIHSPPVRCEIFGLSGRSLTARPDDGRSMVILLRCASHPPLPPDKLQSLLATPVPCATIELSSRVFSYSIRPVEVGDGRLIPLQKSGHIVFGAQLRIPPGRWRATFRMQLKRSWPMTLLQWAGAESPKLTIDIYRIGIGIAAIADIVPPVNRHPTLEFESEADSAYEFRVYFHGQASAQLLEFHGVNLTLA